MLYLNNQYAQVCSYCTYTIYERDCKIKIITTIVVLEKNIFILNHKQTQIFMEFFHGVP